MNNQIFNQSFLKVFKHSYEKAPSSFKIKGVLVDIKERNIKIDLGSNKMMDVSLKERINAKVGDTVVIERSNIVKSRLFDAGTNNVEQQKSMNLLRALKLPITNDTEEALKTLEKFDINLNKNNVQSFMSIKKQLSKVIGGLDYDIAIKLMEKNVDIQKETIQKLAEEIENIKSEKKGFSFSKLLSWKREMKTEEAEKISSKMYGNKMGKDITDAIKALHKAGLEITKVNVNKINDVLNKVDDIQAIKDETLVDLVKNKIATSIDHLFKMKNNIMKGSIQSDNHMGAAAAKAYGNSSGSQVTAKELKLLEEDIKALLNEVQLDTSEDLVNLSKKFIKSGLEVTKENINMVLDFKDAVAELKGLLNAEKASLLMKSEVDIEKMDIRDLVRELKQLHTQIENHDEISDSKKTEVGRQIEGLEKMTDQEIIDLIKRGGDLKLEILRRILLKPESEERFIDSAQKESDDFKNGVNYSLKLVHMMNRLRNIDSETLAHEINQKRPMTLESLNHRLRVSKEEANELREEVNKLSENGLKELETTHRSLHFIRENMSVQMAVGATKDQLKLEGMELVRLQQYIKAYEQNLSQLLPQEPIEESKLFKTGFEQIRLMETIKSIEIDTLAFQINNKLPMTLKALSLSQEYLNNSLPEGEYLEQMEKLVGKPIGINMPKEVSPGSENSINSYLKESVLKLGALSEDTNLKAFAKSIINNNLSLNRINLLDIYERHQQLEKIAETLSADFISKLKDVDQKVLSMDIKELMNNIEEANKSNSAQMLKKNDIQELINNISNMEEGHKDSLISLLMKNALPVNLKEVNGLFKFLNNKEQIGSQINEILTILKDIESKKEFKETASELREVLKDLSKVLKTGKGIPLKPYESFAKILESLESKSNLLDESTKQGLRTAGEKLFDSLELQVKLNREDTIFQMPYMFNDQMKNLQLYVMNNKKGSKRIDPNNMSLLLNFDTNNLGNVNIYVGVNYKRVIMKMGLQTREDSVFAEKHSETIASFLKELGYELKEISFNSEEKQNLMDIIPEAKDKQQWNINKIDVKI